MSYPQSVTVGPVAFAIKADEEVTDAARCWGRIDYARQSISIDPRAGDDHIAVTVLHETLHALCHIAGIGDKDTEEQMVTKMSPLLLDTLRRNPALVAYLMDGAA